LKFILALPTEFLSSAQPDGGFAALQVSRDSRVGPSGSKPHPNLGNLGGREYPVAAWWQPSFDL